MSLNLKGGFVGIIRRHTIIRNDWLGEIEHRGVAVTDPSRTNDAAIDAENKALDRKLKSICRGC